ncbi:hypothetical protein NEMBOFW57_007568 [Staphylotrichum longicolle]|uniref:Nuclear segregation protein n=1 Tax=Staphylotrichum longicolle TaxID=669026 RepID=A0AAD4I0K1_9PEZI|nr:hypothetical protein NEMBOFW57_007568 [Staphylotrichum longicolle]
MATETNAPAAAAPAVPATKPTKPDEDVFKKELAKLEKEHKAALDQYNAVKAKIELAVPNKDKENPTQKRRAELIAQANEIRKKQGVGKQARTSKLDQIKRYDEQLRSRIAEQKTARSKVSYKSVEEIDKKIKDLESEVDRGQMKLVDEKKALADITSLRKLRKNFSAFDNDQKAIDDLKAKIKEIKDSMEDPEAKAMSEEYSKIQAELDTIKAEQDSVYKNLSALRKERDDLRNKQQATWEAVKKCKDDYHTQRKAALAWERQAREKRREREQEEREKYNKERKMARAQQMLAEASDPAFAEEIRRADNLARFFDPSHVAEAKTPLLADKGLAASAQRKVDASGFEGMKLVRKEDRDDDYLPAAKKGKKGKKSHAAETPAAAAKFSCPPSVMEDCTFIGINPPMSAAEVPEVLEKNIEKAKKEIERLEAEEAKGSGASTPKGDKEDADKTVAEATEKVAEVSLNDKEAEATA